MWVYYGKGAGGGAGALMGLGDRAAGYAYGRRNLAGGTQVGCAGGGLPECGGGREPDPGLV